MTPDEILAREAEHQRIRTLAKGAERRPVRRLRVSMRLAVGIWPSWILGLPETPGAGDDQAASP